MCQSGLVRGELHPPAAVASVLHRARSCGSGLLLLLTLWLPLGRSFLRFWLSFPQETTRNDVSLPAGQIFFTNGCWADDELNMAEQAVVQLQQEIDAIDGEASAGDTGVLGRVADIRTRACFTRACFADSTHCWSCMDASGAGLVSTLVVVATGARRYEERELLMLKLRTVAQSLPGPSGVVDGPRGIKVGKRGGISVKRRECALPEPESDRVRSNLSRSPPGGPWYRGFGEEFHILGTFSMTPLEDDAAT